VTGNLTILNRFACMMYGRKYQCVRVALLPGSFPSHTRQCLAVGFERQCARLPWTGFVPFQFWCLRLGKHKGSRLGVCFWSGYWYLVLSCSLGLSLYDTHTSVPNLLHNETLQVLTAAPGSVLHSGACGLHGRCEYCYHDDAG
jgi:hypothetical protein